MTNTFTSPLVRVAVFVLVLAVVLCLAVPMSGNSGAEMDFALLCCFVLAIALSVFVLRRARQTLILGGAFGSVVPLPRPARNARAPDLVGLGSLLI